MKHNRNPLAKAVRYALGAGVVAGLAATASPVVAQDDEAADLERFQVTGTRISRTDVEGALPVTVIDRETIEFSGKTSVADLLRNTPFNSAGSFRPQSGSTGQSFAGLSLRALGTGRTLILVDGRRAPVAPNIGSAQDLNAIPLAAVERIEILSDGASAIYGTDAIGGVVNIITRKDFTGVELTVGFSDPDREGGDTEEGSVVIGAAGDRGRVMFGASYNERDIVFQRDRPWTAGTGASTFSNNLLRSNGAFLDHEQFGSIVPGDGCTGPSFFTGGSGTSGRCFYDFTAEAADEAATRNESLFARGSYDINNDWSFYANAGVSRVTSFGRYAPVPSSPWLVGGFGFPVLQPGTPNHPGTPADQGGLNPQWAQYQGVADETLLFAHRFAANGPRDTSTDANTYDIDVGFQGYVAGWEVDFGARRTDSQYHEIGRNYIVSALAQPQIDAGNYNIYDPFSASDDVLQSFTATIGRDARTLEKEIYAMANTDLFDMPAGPVGFAIGAEYRETDYHDIFDDLQANGNITGSAGNSAFGDRNYFAVFSELLFPLMDNLELQAALRYDDYSDFGDEFSPKLALRWQPIDEVTFRASWAQGFRAPPLDILAAQPAFSAEPVVHEPTAEFFGIEDPTQSIQITSFSIANPDLDAENSDSYSVGVAFQPFDWLSGSVDFWRIEIEDRVAGIGAQQVLNCIEGTTTNCPPGLSVFGPGASGPDPDLGLGVQFGDQGQVNFLQWGFASLGTIDSDGVDLNLQTQFDLGVGRLTNELQATFTNKFETDGGDNVAGEAGLPEWRATLNNRYSIGDFAFAWNINYIDGQDTAQSPALDGLPSWTTHDVQANYFTPWNGRITLGVDNLTDKDPVLDPGEGRDFNFDLYNPYGRVWYLRYQQNF